MMVLAYLLLVVEMLLLGLKCIIDGLHFLVVSL